MSRILVINCFKRDDYAADFESAMDRVCKAPVAQPERDTVRMTDLTADLDTGRFTHLILSGSETSAIDDNPWNAPLEDVILDWVSTARPLLGICYGHQFLARALAGENYVRPADPPEFGWTNVETGECKLFNGIKHLTAMVSHYDEVVSLPDEFTVFARTERCAIHAFQYRDLPVYGVQFHPEYGPKEADFIFEQVLKGDPAAGQWFIGDDIDPDRKTDCPDIFRNFLTD